jgi:hypothetical protein
LKRIFLPRVSLPTLVAGRYVRGGKNFRVALVEMRKTLLQVAGRKCSAPTTSA